MTTQRNNKTNMGNGSNVIISRQKGCEKIKFIVLCLIVFVSSAFVIIKKRNPEYGLLSVSIINDSIWHYTIVDLHVLDSIKASYGCEINGSFCQVNLDIDAIPVKRSGPHYEIIELDLNPVRVKGAAKGFSFVLNTKK